MKAAVLGSGNGGCAVAFDLAKHGYEVYLFDFPEFPDNIKAISKAGGFYSTGDLAGFAEIKYAGHDIEKVMDGAELIFVVGPAFSTEAFGKVCVQYAKKGQKYVICPGSCGGALAFKNALGLKPADNSIVVAETSTLPYAVRVLGEAKIHVYLKLREAVLFASLPRSENKNMLALLQPVYQCFEPAKNVLQTSLQNANPVIHPTVTILNAALIERTKGNFLFYEEGVTGCVGNLLEAVDKERINIGKALDIEIIPDPVLAVRQGYMYDDSYDLGYSKAPGFRGIKAQSELTNRYLTEDVGYGLVFFSELGRQFGVPTPNMDALICISSTILKRDFAGEKVRTMQSLGLGGYSAEQLEKIL